jgi:hypothetical protein
MSHGSLASRAAERARIDRTGRADQHQIFLGNPFGRSSDKS